MPLCGGNGKAAEAGQGGTIGGAGMLMGILMLAGGIVSIATRKAVGKGGDIALIVLYKKQGGRKSGGIGKNAFRKAAIYAVWRFSGGCSEKKGGRT